MGLLSHFLALFAFPFRICLRTIFYYPKILGAFLDRARGKTTGITGTIEGERKFATGRYAIFVIWQPPGPMPWYIDNALAALAKAETNVLVVSNAPLSDEARCHLTKSCARILLRDNTGHDFGGYRDGVLHLLGSADDIERLILLNDSVYFFEAGIEDFMLRLAASPADICTAFENWERKYHFQSFALSVSGRVAGSDRFSRFWRRYLPVSSRRWAIHAGEIRLAKAILPVIRTIDVIYSPNDLRPSLGPLSGHELLALDSFLPHSQRISDRAQRMRSKFMLEEIGRRIAVRSQIHTGGLLYLRFVQCPLMKRDLVYRMQFSIYEVEHALKSAGRCEHLNHVLSEMRRKGMGTQLPIIKRLQFLDGII